MVLNTKRCFYKISQLHLSARSGSKNKYSATVLLPQTKLPLRLEKAKICQRDQEINNLSEFKNLYKWQRDNLKGPDFILHDGPPYANGDPHMGHAINKILKDTILRHRILKRQRVHYVPGWDCHGLPIELKALVDSKAQLKPLQIRRKARNFAEDAKAKQQRSFQSWGVIGDWENSYKTSSPSYVMNQLKQFYKLYEMKLIYRDLKPVYWSPSSKTALAEAELDYNEKHKSTAVTLKLKVHHFSVTSDFKDKVFALIWTTTPWTLPCNQAVCCSPDISYSLVKNSANNEMYIIASKLVEPLSQKLQDHFSVLMNFKGSDLKGTTYQHPFDSDRILPILMSDHATEAKGTGLVHTAPAHGPEDFLVALRHKLSMSSLVDEHGCYTPEVDDSELCGLNVLTAGTEAVLRKLENYILNVEEYVHSYPYDWRTKEPVIIRASQQWFLDTEAIKNKAIELLEPVEIYPEISSKTYKTALVNYLRKRPFWCISRQRVWGVPIPAFYNKSTGEPVVKQRIIDNLCNLIEKKGTDVWWNLTVNELIPLSVLQELDLTETDLVKGQDILDIWFDSGLSWSAVLSDKVADLCLEGVDQFTGWFQSSLITSAALRHSSPYKSLYVHGFAVDENGQKMSKSLGNVVDPQDILKGGKGKKTYGVDVLRWWVVCHANRDSVAEVSDNVLQASADEVQKVRSVLRFSVGALNDYTEGIQNVTDSLQIIDKYMLHLLWEYQRSANNLYELYQFSKLGINTTNLLTNHVSAVYYPAIKDRLYCDEMNYLGRRAAQYVLLQIFYVVTHAIGPIVPHLTEELYQYFPLKKSGSFFQDPQFLDSSCNNPTVKSLMDELLLNIKKDLHKEVGASTTERKLYLGVTGDVMESIKVLQPDVGKLRAELSDLFQVSEVEIDVKDNIGKAYTIRTEKSDLKMCKRCRKYNVDDESELCRRCFEIVESVNKRIFAN